MRIRIGLTLLMITLCASPAFAVTPEEGYFDVDEEQYQLPPDEELTPVPSLAPEEREDLYEYLDMLGERHGYYSLERKDNLREAFELETIADWVEQRRRWTWGPGESTQEKIDEVRHPLRDMHDPWLFVVAFGAFDEEPVDWGIVWRALRILRQVDPHPDLVDPDPDTERLVRKVFRQPIAHPLPGGQNTAIRKSLSRLRQWWPDEPWPEYAAEKWETALTLPDQPSDRDILPLAEGESREAEAEVAEAAASEISFFHAYRERGSEVVERVETGADEGQYTITPRLAQAIEGVQEAWAGQGEKGRPPRPGP